MNIFSCKHPFKYLVVEKWHTEKKIDDDFLAVDYHLYCTKCGKNDLTIKQSKLIGGVKEFLAREAGEQNKAI